MFSVSWFARNTAIVIYNNYFNDNGSNKNEDTQEHKEKMLEHDVC